MKSPALIPLFSFKLPLLALCIAFQGAILSGCSSHSALMVEQVEKQTGHQQQIQKVVDALKITESRVAVAQSNNVDIYAPRQMAEAKDALGEARRYTERFQSDPENVNRSISLFFGDTMGDKALSLIAQANAALDQAEDHKKQADAIFAEANENFIWLKKFQAPINFRYEYEDLEYTQRYLIEYVADGKLEAARQGLPRLLKEQQALEIAAAQRFHLHSLNQKIHRQEGGVVERYASLSYSAAIGALNRAHNVIANNTRDEAAIEQAKADAEFSFAVANAVAADMQSLTKMDREEMERWLILLEAKLFEIGNSIGAKDVRDHKLMQQLQLLGDASAAHKDKSIQQEEQVAAAAPSELATDTDTADTTEETAISQRMNQLEQSLSEQIKALSEQLQTMKSANKNAQATPSYQIPDTAPAPKRKALSPGSVGLGSETPNPKYLVVVPYWFSNCMNIA